jgi:hypothetical protein
MSISIVLTESEGQIGKNINAAIVTYINDTLSKNLNLIVNKVKLLIPNWVMSQPEIASLSSSDSLSLAGQFGIVNGASAGQAIANSVAQATRIKFVKYSNNFNGGLELQFQQADFNNLLSLREGHTVYQGGNLHWLDWLLKRGDSIIISNYQYNPATGLGRSGLGNMIGGGVFRVPPEFAGTPDNNFITRALIGTAQEQQITDIIQKILM